MPAFVNIAAYRFAPLEDLKPLRERLLKACIQGGLKGTILLSTEGINLFVAGAADEIEKLLSLLRAIKGLAELEPKYSESDEQPFTRMLVRIKREIIAFGVEGINPIHQPAPRLSPRELKIWLDEGRPVTLLDTRNDFEIAMGTFQNAHAIGIKRFRDFPAAADTLNFNQPQPIVTFCTGGIRCEKAAPYLIQKGFDNVFQLDGGILKYFEECGSEHFKGECFVFDKRVGLAADLDESGHGFCHACQSILTPEELTDPRYISGISCPKCHRPDEEIQKKSLEEHREKLRHAVSPLPGRFPQDNYRPLKVHARHEGIAVLDFLCDVFKHIPRHEWQQRCHAGDIVDAKHVSISADHVVRPGEAYFTRELMHVEPDVNPGIEIIYEDNALIVINKPAPLPMHPCGRFQRNTLERILRTVYAPQKPRPAHRLDANTTGVAVFTRTATYARIVQPQFEQGLVQKLYLARVQGHPPENHFSCEASILAVPSQAGPRIAHETEGQSALTNFEVLTRLPDGTALLRVIPHTGRTNQIRVHLWHLGFPIVGDAMYKPDQQLGGVQTVDVDATPLCLHAWQLTFSHPLTRKEVTFEAPRPGWA